MFVRNLKVLHREEMSYFWKFRVGYGKLSNIFYYQVMERDMLYLTDHSPITEMIFNYLVSCERYFGETLIV